MCIKEYESGGKYLKKGVHSQILGKFKYCRTSLLKPFTVSLGNVFNAGGLIIEVGFYLQNDMSV